MLVVTQLLFVILGQDSCRKVSHVVVFAAIFLLFDLTFCSGLNVYIDDERGEDVESCFSKSFPCKSIHYGYKKAMQNETLAQLDLILLTNYKLSNSLHLNISHGSLKSLGISSVNESKEITSNREEMIFFGSPEPGSQLVNYSVSIQDLVFRNFSSSAVVSITRVNRVYIKRCVFIENEGSAIHGIDSGMWIEDCRFETNYARSYPAPGSSSLGGTVALVFQQLKNSSSHVIRSSFVNNSACLNVSNFDASFNKPDLERRYFGGGVSLTFLNESSENNFSIADSYFGENKALFGAGFSLQLCEKSQKNSIVITNSVFDSNHALLSGGGFSVHTFPGTLSNIIAFHNATFINNTAANSGGGGTLILQDVNLHPTPIQFINTSFISNRASVDAALGINSFLRNLVHREKNTVGFTDCVFKHNGRFLDASSFVHTGTLVSYDVNLAFKGFNLFASNSINSPLYVCKATIIVTGNLTFFHNYAYARGGGMSLVDGSFLLLMPGAALLFHQNFAQTWGGAIFHDSNLVENQIYPYNPRCFMQYYEMNTPASQWNVSAFYLLIIGFLDFTPGVVPTDLWWHPLRVKLYSEFSSIVVNCLVEWSVWCRATKTLQKCWCVRYYRIDIEYH